MTATSTNTNKRILVVGRSPNVLEEAVAILRGKGYAANATNQFASVMDDYDVAEIDVVVFGGMIPAETKAHLREQISTWNRHVTFLQGLAGIAGLIAAQVQGLVASGQPDGSEVAYDAEERTVRITLDAAAHVAVTAWWATSFAPPEPTSTSLALLENDLPAAQHKIALPDRIPSEASFVTVAVGSAVHTFTVGPMPDRVTRLVPTSGSGSSPTAGHALPPVRPVTTQ